MPKPVILIDCMNAIFRSHYAHVNLSAEGKPTGVLFGMLKIIHDLRQTVSPHLVFVWDHGVPVLGAAKPRNWREGFIQNYKANRVRSEEHWPNIVSQLPDLYKVIRLLGYSNIASMGLEADDVIGILSREIPGDILVFSTDKDFYQLLCNRIKILVPKKDRGIFAQVTVEDVEKEFGISIADWDKFLALGGDSADNIKAMKGMGPKTAIKLIKAGALPDLPWKEQRVKFQEEYAKYQPVWELVNAAYIAARLPRNRNDSRFAGGNYNFSSFDNPCSQVFGSNEQREENLQHFTKFCAERNMNSILSVRRSLFDSNLVRNSVQNLPPQKETSCQEPNVPKPMPKKNLPRKTLI